MDEPETGDLVVVKTREKAYEGFLLPAPSLKDSDKILLKLSSGYNIGFNKSDILEIKLVEKYVAVDKQQKPHVADPTLPSVSVLSTGGTISSKLDYRTGGVSAALSAAELLDAIPELKGRINLNPKSVMNVMSEDMNPGLWAVNENSQSSILKLGLSDGIVA